MIRILRHAALSMLAISLTGVSAFAQQKKEKKQEEAPPPARSPEDLKALSTTAGAPVDPKSYKLGAEDVVKITVWREADLSGLVVIRPDGKISIPLGGEIQASGLTPEELQTAIITALSKDLNKPQVFVQVQQVNSRKYYITGMVLKPGQYPLITTTTFLEAISGAGGLQEYANKKKITIIRGTKRLKFNYKEVLDGKNLTQNIPVENGDQIIVE